MGTGIRFKIPTGSIIYTKSWRRSSSTTESDFFSSSPPITYIHQQASLDICSAIVRKTIWTEKTEIRQNSWQQARHAQLFSGLLQAKKTEPFDRSDFLSEGTWTFASVVHHRGVKTHRNPISGLGPRKRMPDYDITVTNIVKLNNTVTTP